MEITFYTSSAGIAGDPDKLLVAQTKEYRLVKMYDSMSLFNWNYYYSQWVLTRRIRKLYKPLK